MADTGAVIAGTGASVAYNSGNAWSNPGNITANDSSYATANFSSGANTEYIQGTNFGFAVPAGATINGILLEVERNFQTSAAVDLSVRIVKGGTVVGSDKASATAWTTGDVIATYGSSVDLWGTTWTATDINSSTFGAALAADTNTGAFGTARVDFMRITVYFTAAATSNSAFFAFM